MKNPTSSGSRRNVRKGRSVAKTQKLLLAALRVWELKRRVRS